MGCYMVYGIWCMVYGVCPAATVRRLVMFSQLSAAPLPVRPMTNSLTLRIRNMAMA